MTKNLRVLLVACLPALLAGCASMEGGGRGAGAPCSTHYCRVTVTVDASCRISVAPEDLPIAAANKNAVIQWDIVGGSFPQGAIAFKDDPGDEFHGWSHSPRVITVVDRHDKVGVTYRYGVTVIGSNGKACPTLDPTIMN
jgi:hypothetical protein